MRWTRYILAVLKKHSGWLQKNGFRRISLRFKVHPKSSIAQIQIWGTKQSNLRVLLETALKCYQMQKNVKKTTFRHFKLVSKILLHQICCLFWSPQMDFCFRIKIYKKIKINIYLWFVRTRIVKPTHEQIMKLFSEQISSKRTYEQCTLTVSIHT